MTGAFENKEEQMSRYLCVLAAAAVLASGCGKKPAEPAEAGKTAANAGPTVKFLYTLKVDGNVLESSEGKGPLSVTLGNHKVIPGLEEALASMKAGEKRTVTVAPEKGYGPYLPERVTKVPKTAFKDMSGLKPGMMVSGNDRNGRPFQAKVKEVGSKDVTLDLNHPLAGKTLSFDVEMVAIQPAGT
jgi:FKBP-type peptidyl-prolyl cis-trans isomerase 2